MIKNSQYDVAIVGGGMVGMTLAVALAREGLSIAVIERGKLEAQLDASFDGRVSAIALGSKRIFENIGLWASMEKEAEPIRDIRVTDSATPFFLHYDHEEVRDATGGDPFGYIVENRYIRHALHSAARQLNNISLFDKTTVESFECDDFGCTVILSEVSAANATEGSNSLIRSLDCAREDNIIRCRLLIGADGKQSDIRKLADIASTEWNYRQTAIVCTIAHEKSHEGLAQERFLPAGPFAVLPMTNSRSSLVWVEPDDRVSLYLDLPEEEFVQEITERVGGYLGKIRVEGNRFSYPLSLMHARTYIGQRLALIGDAAHAIHPIAGQGVNLGFRDVAALTELITTRFKRGSDIGSDDVLLHYQRWRRFDNVVMLGVTDMLNRLFSNNIIPIQWVRDIGLFAVGKMPPLKRFFMKHAMGLTGDLPELIRLVKK
jgi:2-octaprenyl-6-methoxyphenol hydroxylase